MYTYAKYGNRTPCVTVYSKAPHPGLVSKFDSQEREKKKAIHPKLLENFQSALPEKANQKPRPFTNDFLNDYVHTGQPSTQHIRNVECPTEGYPKLQKLKELKHKLIEKHAVQPFGVRAETRNIVPLLNSWVRDYALQFDVIMIGALVENQFLLPLLELLPLYKLCAKPGFLFIWTHTSHIKQLSTLLNSDKWNKKFRRSEELVFVPVDEKSPYFPGRVNDGFYHEQSLGAKTVNGNGQSLFKRTQWHCWMCITGTVRRSTDAELIHCNIDTDLQMSPKDKPGPAYNNAVPEAIYKVAENFSNSNRRLHIVPCRTGFKIPVRMRRGWVVMLPDVLVDNFDPAKYEAQLQARLTVKHKTVNTGGARQVSQYLVPQTREIELLRPKSPS